MDRGFKSIYSEIMMGCRAELETLRKNSIKSRNIAIIVGVIIFLIITAIVITSSKSPGLIIVPISIVLFVYIELTSCFLVSPKYSKLYKEKIIRPLIKQVFNDAEYNPYAKISNLAYNGNNEGLYQERYDRILGDDLVITNNKDSLVFSELKVQKYTTDSDGNREITTVFNGIAGSFDSPVHFETPIKILRNATWGDKINIDSMEFEKKFNLLAKDRIKALSILTPDVMQEISLLSNNFGNNIEFVFFRDKVYFRILRSRVFEAGLSKDDLNPEILKKSYDLLCNIRELYQKIIDILNNADI